MHDFHKSKRLIKKLDFSSVFEKAHKCTTMDFVVLYIKNSRSVARLGLAISKRMVMKAHDRNRIKRQIRESFRKQTLPAVDVVFLAKKGLSTKSNADIAKNLGKLWSQLSQASEK